MWTNAKDIKQQLNKRWEKGFFLSALVRQEPIFPLKLKLVKPTSSDISQHFEQVRRWVSELMALPYLRIEWKSVAHRIQGEQRLPESFWIENVNDVLNLLNQRKAYQQFQQLLQITQQQEPALLPWLEKYPFKALATASQWESVLNVIVWKKQHPTPNIYLRQVDIPQVHSKFIEQNRGLFCELFDQVLEPESVRSEFSGVSQFHQRYGFLAKPQFIRLRNLDPNFPLLPQSRYSDLQLDCQSFSQLSPKVSNILITENETSYLALPDLPNTWAIFGSGYGFRTLAQADWLQRCQIYYWGDIDTHGFAILNQLRHDFPHAVSLLMNEQILLDYRELCSLEAKPFQGNLPNLTSEEQAVFNALKQDKWGEKLRLEQEFIPFSTVERELKSNIR